MILNAVLVCSAGTFCLALLDVLLSDSQKKIISNYTTKAWDYLDSTRRRLSTSPRFHFEIFWVKWNLIGALQYTVVVIMVVLVLGYALTFYELPEDEATISWKEHWAPLMLAALLIFALGLLVMVGFDVLLWLARAILYCVLFILFLGIELVIRRVAEHPKGPVIAVSGAFAGIAGLAKTYI